MEVNCCCSVAHQPSSAGQKELFTRKTTTMPSTSRTTKSTQEMIVVAFPHSTSVQNTFRTIVDVGIVVYHFRNFSSSATALCMAIFRCASADYDWVEHITVAQHMHLW
jgi:hypothetical protein